jgi:hypothetical protein
MSDTKALERALNLVLKNTVLCASYGGIFREASVELSELYGKIEYLKMVCDSEGIHTQYQAGKIKELNTALNDARDTMELVVESHPFFLECKAWDKCEAWLKAHPK